MNTITKIAGIAIGAALAVAPFAVQAQGYPYSYYTGTSYFTGPSYYMGGGGYSTGPTMGYTNYGANNFGVGYGSSNYGTYGNYGGASYSGQNYNWQQYVPAHAQQYINVSVGNNSYGGMYGGYGYGY